MGVEPDEYEVTCPWCEAEGIHTVVRYSSVAGSHSICARHAAAMVAETHRQGVLEQMLENQQGKRVSTVSTDRENG